MKSTTRIWTGLMVDSLQGVSFSVVMRWSFRKSGVKEVLDHPISKHKWSLNDLSYAISIVCNLYIPTMYCMYIYSTYIHHFVSYYTCYSIVKTWAIGEWSSIPSWEPLKWVYIPTNGLSVIPIREWYDVHIGSWVPPIIGWLILTYQSVVPAGHVFWCILRV